ncbi:hypothetical protein TNCV_3547091 [Trichonephila clavipes]|nr:hypothetical protein TNCV_3547091 [Trichonephila clavipes]
MKNRSTCWTKPSNCDADLSSLDAGGNHGSTGLSRTPRCTTDHDDRRILRIAVDGLRIHITNHSTTYSVCYVSFGVHSYHSTQFVVEWNVHKASNSSFTLDSKTAGVNASNGVMNGGDGQRNGAALCFLLTNLASTYNITMVGFEFGDRVVRGCSTLALCLATKVQHPVSGFEVVLDSTAAAPLH